MASSRVLGISLGTRKLGVAVMEHYSIFDCEMKCFNGKWSSRKLQAILAVIERYIVDHNIKHIAIKLPTTTSPAPTILKLLKEIENFAKAKSIVLYTYSIDHLKLAWAGDKKVNKKQLMESVLKKYPELQIEYDKEMKNEIGYYDKLFEAVGVADVVLSNFT